MIKTMETKKACDCGSGLNGHPEIGCEKQSLEKSDNALHISDVMPRFFVDERVGCIAIRDTQHPDFDVEHQGLDADMPCIVNFQIGTLENNEWVVSYEITQRFKDECDSLNEA